MTVAQLKKVLEKYDADAIVVVRGHDHSFIEATVGGEQADVTTVRGRRVMSEWDGEEGREPRAVLVFE